MCGQANWDAAILWAVMMTVVVVVMVVVVMVVVVVAAGTIGEVIMVTETLAMVTFVVTVGDPLMGALKTLEFLHVCSDRRCYGHCDWPQ
jgi:hypothetical protein